MDISSESNIDNSNGIVDNLGRCETPNFIDNLHTFQNGTSQDEILGKENNILDMEDNNRSCLTPIITNVKNLSPESIFEKDNINEELDDFVKSLSLPTTENKISSTENLNGSASEVTNELKNDHINDENHEKDNLHNDNLHNLKDISEQLFKNLNKQPNSDLNSIQLIIDNYKNVEKNVSCDTTIANNLIKFGLNLTRENIFKTLKNKTNDKEIEKICSLSNKNELNDNEIKCKFCLFKTKYISLMEHHKVTILHTLARRLICAKCCKLFNDITNYKKHMSTAHKSVLLIESKMQNFSCANCSFQIFDVNTFYLHSKQCKGKGIASYVQQMDVPCFLSNGSKPKIKANNTKSQSATKNEIKPPILPKNDIKSPETTINNTVRLTPNGPLLQLPSDAKPLTTPANQPPRYMIKNKIYQLIKSSSSSQYVLTPIEKILQENQQNVIKQNNSIEQILNSNNSKPAILTGNLKNVKEYNKMNEKFEKCESCNLMISGRDALMKHFEFIHNIKIPIELKHFTKPPFSCDICKERYWMLPTLLMHRKSIHKYIHYNISNNEKQSTLVTEIIPPINSSKTTNSMNNNPCNVSSYSIQNNAKQTTVVKEIVDPSYFKTTNTNINNNNTCKVVSISNMNLNTNNVDKKMYTCYICQEKVEFIVKHMTLRHGIDLKKMFNDLRCMVCSRKFTVERYLEEHILLMHAEIFRRKAPKKVETNPLTSAQFLSAKSDSEDFNFNILNSLHACNFCNIKLNEKSLAEHIKRNHHICRYENCGFYFKSKQSLSYHCKFNHCGISKHCEICNIEVKRGLKYIEHMKTHIKPCYVKLKRYLPTSVSSVEIKDLEGEPPFKKIKTSIIQI